MTSALTEEQQMLEDSLARFIEREYSFEQRNVIIASDAGLSRDHWRQFAELGWLAAGLPEDLGGLGGGPVEQMLIGTAFGRAMVVEPYVSTAVAGAHALTLASNEELRDSLLADLVGGELLLGLAYAERSGRFDLYHQETTARPAGNAFVLSGEKLAVNDAPGADKLIVAARMSGDTRDRGGIGLFLVDAKAPEASLATYRGMDGTPGAHVQFDSCPAELLVDESRGLNVLEEVVERAIAVRCAQAAGAMSAAFEQTVEYAKTREQFGVAIGSFQVIQHRLVDLMITARECKAMAAMVAEQVTASSSQERRAAVSAAKSFVGKRALRAAQEVVQLHGGIGMTEEYSIGHYFRYLTQFCTSFGSTAHHLQRFAQAG